MTLNPLAFYPSLATVSPSFDTLPAACGPHHAAAGKVLFNAGALCQGFPLVLAGEIKVMQQSVDGRSIELYRVAPGELCLVSSASLFKQQPLLATGICSCATDFLLVPANVFDNWLTQAAFRADVLGLFAQRMSDLTALVEAVAFQKLDQRLAAILLQQGDELTVTHQALAEQLGTVREVITRLLRRMEQQGYLCLSHKHIHINDRDALLKITTGDLSH